MNACWQGVCVSVCVSVSITSSVHLTPPHWRLSSTPQSNSPLQFIFYIPQTNHPSPWTDKPLSSRHDSVINPTCYMHIFGPVIYNFPSKSIKQLNNSLTAVISHTSIPSRIMSFISLHFGYSFASHLFVTFFTPVWTKPSHYQTPLPSHTKFRSI